MSPRVLLVEDDDTIARPLVRTLEREGYAVERVTGGLAALEVVTSAPPQLVILDLGLPDIDGLDVCRRAREGGYPGSIMILTARGGELDRVVGLDIGADDYLAKPFPLSEMLARVRALLRRSGVGQDGAAGTPGATPEATSAPAAAVPSAAPAAPPVPPAAASPAAPPAAEPAPRAAATEGFRVDTRARRVWVGSREMPVSAKEFDVLALLDAEPGAVVTRELLMDRVWDENWFGSTRTLDATIGRLRQKLEDHRAPARIDTVRGVGFRMEREAPDA
ncbi:response regulator transcription factor [Nocardioides xinjiangensis]|uniref:response regulator transcription factor n=1 Tax=Nocardioides xinjiangensis TaxID=2817376 RepID=UPI001FEF5761|nr:MULTISPECIES: response regulator transcription factor [unclassified Nocardioides]